METAIKCFILNTHEEAQFVEDLGMNEPLLCLKRDFSNIKRVLLLDILYGIYVCTYAQCLCGLEQYLWVLVSL